MSIELAEKFEENEEYEKAYEEYKKVLDKKPKSKDILERLAHLASLLKKNEDAEIYYSKILEQDATNILAYEQLMDIFEGTDRYKYYTYRGNLHVCQNQVSHAINDFKKALNKACEDKQVVNTRFVLANLYVQSGKINSAIDEYLRILDFEDETSEFVYIKLAELYEKEDLITSSVEILERGMEKGCDTDTLKEFLANCYLKCNMPSKAGKLCVDKLTQIKCLLQEEKFDTAFEIIEEIRDENKKNSKFLALVAQYYYETGDFDEALLMVDEFEKFDKKSPLAYQMRAMIYENKKDGYKEHYNWAKYNLALGNQEVALNEYLLALQFDEKNSELVSTLADLLDSMGDNTHAIEFYERLNKLEPNNKKALEKLAEFRINLGDYRIALDYLEKLYCIDNRNSWAIKNLAQTYEKLKNGQKALDFYNKYLSISQKTDEYDVIKKKINKLENNNAKDYKDSSMEEEGLIGWISNLFNKK